MLGKSLRGDYVFSSEGDLIKAAGQAAAFYKVGILYSHVTFIGAL